MASTTMIKDPDLNTDPGRDRLRNPAPLLGRQWLRAVGMVLGALVVTMTLSACEPTDNSSNDNGETPRTTTLGSGSYSSSMGDNNIKSKTQRPEHFSACPDPRPEMCTLQYQPACGYFFEGEGDEGEAFRTFGNHCTACQNATVEGYVRGECPEDEAES